MCSPASATPHPLASSTTKHSNSRARYSISHAQATRKCLAGDLAAFRQNIRKTFMFSLRSTRELRDGLRSI